jgi:hypothetical protein
MAGLALPLASILPVVNLDSSAKAVIAIKINVVCFIRAAQKSNGRK